MNLSADVKNWKLIVVAGALALPLFIVLNGASVSLPKNYFEVSGIPIHANFLLFLFLPKTVLLNYRALIIFFAFLIYCMISLLHSVERFQLTIQIGYFIYGFKIIQGLNEKSIKSLDKYLAIFATALILLHSASLGLSVISGNILSAATEGIFGFVVYQSHLTYPIIIVLLLVSVSRNFRGWRALRIFIIILAFSIEIFLMRRVGFGLFLVFLFLFERRLFIFSLFSGLLVFLAFSDIRESVLKSLSFAERLIQIRGNGTFSRAMTWERTFERLSDPSTLIFGNGLNNHSHNFFLHTVSTHGLLISFLIFVMIGFWVYKTLGNKGLINKYSILAFVIIAIDWNLNVNLYQPYYSLLFAFFLIASSRFTKSAQITKKA